MKTAERHSFVVGQTYREGVALPDGPLQRDAAPWASAIHLQAEGPGGRLERRRIAGDLGS